MRKPTFDNLLELGLTYKDKISGFQGIATAEYRYANGCVRYEIAPTTLKDGAMQESAVFDREQLELVKTKKSIFEEDTRPSTGGPVSRKPVARR